MRLRRVEKTDGNRRTRIGFLWFPRCINDEWRWLEDAAWLEKRVKRMTTDDMGNPVEVKDWEKVEWLGVVQKDHWWNVLYDWVGRPW